MLHHIKKLFGFGQKADAPAVDVPYKVETPAVSPVTEQAAQAVVESIAKSVKAKKAPAVKKPRAPKKPKAV